MKPEQVFELIKKSKFITVGDDVQYCVFVNHAEKRVYLIFEESTSDRDWVNNFNFPVKLYKNQEHFFLYHRGWGNAYKTGNDAIMADFIEAANTFSDYETEVCGWSYGGAITPLAVEDYYYRTGKQIDYVETFGAPNGIFGFFSWLHFIKCAKSWEQYTLSYDIVTWMPPIIGYCKPRTTLIDKKNCWKMWRIFNPGKWHQSYGDPDYYE